MCREDLEGLMLPFSAHRHRCYKIDMPTKAYIDEESLQIQVREPPVQKVDRNRAVFRKLFNYYHQKQRGGAAPQKKHLNKLEICRELTSIQDTYQKMMELKVLLNSEYDSLLK
jgi:hypothetical protein